METTEIVLAKVYQELFNLKWRHIVYHGGRCLARGSLVHTPGGLIEVQELRQGDKVYSFNGKEAVVREVYDCFSNGGSQITKPMVQLNIGKDKLKVTYDHGLYSKRKIKGFKSKPENGGYYIPAIIVVWGIMETTERQKFTLLCKQYGEIVDDKIQRWILDFNNETSQGRKRISSDGGQWPYNKNSPYSGTDMDTESVKQGNSKSQEWNKDGQQSRELGVGDTSREHNPRRIERVSSAPQGGANKLFKTEGERRFRDKAVKEVTQQANEEGVSGTLYSIRSYNKGRNIGQELGSFTAVVSEPEETFDLTVEGESNYLVGEEAVVVHNSSGKSTAVAYALLLRGRQAKTRILCTREFQNSIADSVHKLLKDLIDKHGFTDYIVQNDTIRNTITGTEFIFKGLKKDSQAIKSLEGVDLCWVEEAQTISKGSIDILIPTIRKDGSQIIWTFNRVTELDPVYVEIVTKADDKTFVLQVNSDALEAIGQLPQTMIEEREKMKVNDPSMYAHVWLGQPLSQVDNAILARADVLEAMNREADEDGAIEIGADIARMGNDRTEFVKRKGHKEIGRVTFSKLRTTEVCDQLEAFAENDKTVLIKVDDTGVGGGVTDEMMKRGYNVMAINFGSKAMDSDKYPNLISEAWFYMQQIIRDIQLLQDNDLLMELSNRAWVMDSKGRRGVEGKDAYKKRGYRSPDKADATILCFYTPTIHVVEWATADMI